MVLQVAFVFGVSAGFAWWMPGVYLMIGIGVTALAFMTLMLRWGDDQIDDDEEPSIELSIFAVEFVYRLLLAAVLGVIWPSIPVIVGARKTSPKDVAHRSNTSD